MFSATVSTWSRMPSIAATVSSTARRPCSVVSAVSSAPPMISWARSDMWAPDWVISVRVAVVCSIEASCSATAAACSCAEARICAVAELRFSAAPRVRVATWRRLALMSLSARARSPSSSLRPTGMLWVRSPRPMRSAIAIDCSSGIEIERPM